MGIKTNSTIYMNVTKLSLLQPPFCIMLENDVVKSQQKLFLMITWQPE